MNTIREEKRWILSCSLKSALVFVTFRFVKNGERIQMQDLQTGLKCTGIYYGESNRKHTEGVDDETRNWGKKINHQLSAEQCLTEHFLVFQCHTMCFLHINQVINIIFHSVPPISILLFFMNKSAFLLKECMGSQHQAASCSAGPHVC